MNFIADQQTLEDLALLGKYRGNSIFSLFNGVQTAGGEQLLLDMFRYPLTDVGAINERSGVFQYFQQTGLEFPFDIEELVKMEGYLKEAGRSSWWGSGMDVLKKRILGLAIRDEGYGATVEGIRSTMGVLYRLYRFIQGLKIQGPYEREIRLLQQVFDHPLLSWVLGPALPGAPSGLAVVRYEHLFRHVLQAELKVIVEAIYHLDVYLAVAATASQKGFSYAMALPRESNVLSATNLRHPGIEKAVGNEVSFDQQNNFLFLTGANMAGKSTFMKSVGISFYLAHMGFPVAAESMKFSVRDGLWSSINVPDNLDQGLSHFYAEVLRVKKVAEAVSSGSDLLVIFDELFKGTNVKDAYDATLAVSAAFSEYSNCVFIISTHIIEVGEALREHRHVRCSYLPTLMEGNVPRYTYRLRDGITADRHGMLIIANEGILNIN